GPEIDLRGDELEFGGAGLAHEIDVREPDAVGVVEGESRLVAPRRLGREPHDEAPRLALAERLALGAGLDGEGALATLDPRRREAQGGGALVGHRDVPVGDGRGEDDAEVDLLHLEVQTLYD